jgi:integrase
VARDFREHLAGAGVTRPELFEQSGHRRPIRVHDLRATFVTLALAAGRSEAWVADRTGHTGRAR